MGQRRLIVQADLLVELAKGLEGEPGQQVRVTNPLPQDAEIVRYQQQPSRYGALSSSVLWVILESSSWEGDELGAGQELPSVAWEVETIELGVEGSAGQDDDVDKMNGQSAQEPTQLEPEPEPEPEPERVETAPAAPVVGDRASRARAAVKPAAQ